MDTTFVWKGKSAASKNPASQVPEFLSQEVFLHFSSVYKPFKTIPRFLSPSIRTVENTVQAGVNC